MLELGGGGRTGGSDCLLLVVSLQDSASGTECCLTQGAKGLTVSAFMDACLRCFDLTFSSQLCLLALKSMASYLVGRASITCGLLFFLRTADSVFTTSSTVVVSRRRGWALGSVIAFCPSFAAETEFSPCERGRCRASGSSKSALRSDEVRFGGTGFFRARESDAGFLRPGGLGQPASAEWPVAGVAASGFCNSFGCAFCGG